MTADTIEQMRPVRRPGGIVVWETDTKPQPARCTICGDPTPAGTCATCRRYLRSIDVDHGTHAGYNREIADGGIPCDDCIEGERVYQRARHQRRKNAGRMSAEDMAWCERAAENHFWQAWERDNRRGGVGETTIRIARKLLSTPPVDRRNARNAERVFDEPNPMERTG